VCRHPLHAPDPTPHQPPHASGNGVT
jgi:hypothetical protein